MLKAGFLTVGALFMLAVGSTQERPGALGRTMLGVDTPCQSGQSAPGETTLTNSLIGLDQVILGVCESGKPAGEPLDTTSTVAKRPPTAQKPEIEGKLEAAPSDTICMWKSIVNIPPPDSYMWEGHSPAEGTLEQMGCYSPNVEGGAGSSFIATRFVPNPAPAVTPPPPPPPDPAVLAQQAYRQLQVPQPLIGAGPDRTKLAVNLWTWLWVDNPGQLSVTVAAGGVSVTATATLASVTWTLGEPGAQGDTYQPGSPTTITCQGAGTAPPASYDWKAQPPCGHKYHWRSIKERTDGTGTWPITATTNWTVTWQSNTGVTGGTTLNATSNDQFDIGEYRTVLVQGGEGG